MADETKKYLVNIESNLSKYAEDAAKAKKEVDALTAANKLLKESGASQAEIEAADAALKNKTAEYKKAQDILKTAIAYTQSETGSRKQLSEQLKLQEQALGKLKNAYVIDAQGVRTLNPLYIQQRKEIKATKDAILEYDKTLGDGRSNIGRYGEAVESAFKDAGSKILSMVGPMALVAAAIGVATKLWDGLKEAIMSTTFAIDLMNKASAISKQLFYDIAINNKINIESLQKASKIQGELNALRIRDSLEQLQISKLNREQQAIREMGIDRTKTDEERLAAFIKVKELESQKTKIQIENLKDELNAKLDLLKIEPANETLLLNIIALRTKIENTYAAEDVAMRRVMGQLTGFEQEKIDKRKAGLEAWHKEIEKDNEATLKQIKDNNEKVLKEKGLMEKYTDEYFEKEKKRNREDLELKKLMARYTDEYFQRENERDRRYQEDIGVGIEYLRLKAGENADTLQTILDTEYAAALASLEYKQSTINEKLLLDQQYTENTRQLSILRIQQQTTELDQVTNIFGSFSGLFTKQTIVAKALSIAQATISTYTAGVKAMAELPLGSGPVLRFLTLASIIAAGLLQVKNIMAVKIPGGGGGGESQAASTVISGSSPAQRTYATQVGATIFTQPQLSQTQINALPNQNTLTAEDIAIAISKLPAPIVTVEDINAKTAEVNKIEVMATI
jgi:hypothetical protein